eukprot:gene22385-29492_t
MASKFPLNIGNPREAARISLQGTFPALPTEGTPTPPAASFTKMTNRPKSEWDASKHKGIDMLEAANRWIGSDKILGFPLGNEPDWFVHNRGWDKEWYFRVNGDYDRDVSRVEEAVRPLLNSMFGTCRMLVASETANFWTSLKTTDRLQQLLKDHRCLRTISTHHYTGSAKSSGYTYDNLLSNEILYGAMATKEKKDQWGPMCWGNIPVSSAVPNQGVVHIVIAPQDRLEFYIEGDDNLPSGFVLWCWLRLTVSGYGL